MSRRWGWAVAFAVTLAIVSVSHLVGLSTAPPGLHTDEASIGYNAWTIAHLGTDQFGTPWPLLFRDFGDYKGPASTYLLAPLTLWLPLTPALTRVPSALAGIALSAAASGLGWRVTRSRGVAMILMLEAAFEPWFFHTARIDLEADLLTALCFVVGLLALAHAGATRPRACAVAALALGLAPFSAQPGRFFGIVFLLLVLTTHARLLGWLRAAIVAVPVVATTLVVLLVAGGSGSARLGGVSVFSGQGLGAGVAAWAGNYLRYLSPGFLLIHGDPNPRHSTGFEGLLFVTALPVVAAGVVVCVRRWREPLCRLALAGLLVAPAGPAITTGISARRDVVFLPFLLLVLTFGWEAVLRWLNGRRLPMTLLAGATAVCAGLYLADYFVAYPARAARAFDSGVAPALVVAQRAAGSHRVLVSSSIPDVAEEALFALRPAPPTTLAELHIVVVTGAAELTTASAGDVAVLSGGEPAPDGFTLIDAESITGPTSLFGASTTTVLVQVYLRR